MKAVIAMVGVLAWAGAAEAQTTFQPLRDTYVDSGNPSSNYGNFDRLSVEYDSGVPLTERSYVYFDVSSVNGDTVTNAILRMWVIRENSANSNFDNYEVYGILSPWTDSLTYTQSQSLNVGALVTTLPCTDHEQNGLNTVSPPEAVDFDVTGLVQGWAAGGTNEGIMIQLDANSKADLRFASMEHNTTSAHPSLIVTHSAGSPGPGPAPGPGPGPAGTPKPSGGDKSDDNCGCSSIASTAPSTLWMLLLASTGLFFIRRR